MEKKRYQQKPCRTSIVTVDISHQFKTLLAFLRLFVEMDEDPHMEQKTSQIERMETLIGSLFRPEKLCADYYEFAFEESAVRPMIKQDWSQLQHL